MRSRKFFALALSLALIVANLTACHKIIQPTCVDIARANFSFLDSPVQVQTELNLVNDTVVAYYDTKVECFALDASWTGKATVYYNDTYFTQRCVSQVDVQTSAKQWRGQWAVSDTGSPTTMIREWLTKIEAGVCLYEKIPLTLALGEEEEQFYQLILSESSMDWKALCDANFDSLFGGQALLDNIREAEITFLIDTQTLQIRQIQIAATGDTWCEAIINVAAADAAPNIQWDTELIQEAYLSEEWTILGSVAEENNTQTE